jgi:hypothetical protein
MKAEIHKKNQKKKETLGYQGKPLEAKGSEL